MGSPESVTVDVFADDLAGIESDTAVINVINAIPGESSISVTLADGTILADSLASGESGDAVSIDSSAQSVSADFTIAGQSRTFELGTETFYGGVYYNVLAVAGDVFTPPALLFEGTSLMQNIASAPGARDMPMAVAETPEPVVVAEPTQEPVVVEVPAPTQIVQNVPIAATLDDVPTARIVLDPGVNLQLREYPNSDARSMGLAPSGTILQVNGREGAPLDIEGNVIPVETASGQITWVDPADSLADRFDDLEPGRSLVECHLLHT